MIALLYIAEKLPALGNFIMCLALFALAFCAIVFITALLNDKENEAKEAKDPALAKAVRQVPRVRQKFGWLAIVGVFFLLVSFAIPSERTMHLMLAAHVIEQQAETFVKSPLYDAIIERLTAADTTAP